MKQLVDHLKANDYAIAGVYLLDSQFIGMYNAVQCNIIQRVQSLNTWPALHVDVHDRAHINRRPQQVFLGVSFGHLSDDDARGLPVIRVFM